jgi:hypothetical protein
LGFRVTLSFQNETNTAVNLPLNRILEVTSFSLKTKKKTTKQQQQQQQQQ